MLTALYLPSLGYAGACVRPRRPTPCVRLVMAALQRRADDNITVAIVKLFTPRPEEDVARSFRRRSGMKLESSTGSIGRSPDSFLQLKRIDERFVRVVGGF